MSGCSSGSPFSSTCTIASSFTWSCCGSAGTAGGELTLMVTWPWFPDEAKPSLTLKRMQQKYGRPDSPRSGT